MSKRISFLLSRWLRKNNNKYQPLEIKTIWKTETMEPIANKCEELTCYNSIGKEAIKFTVSYAFCSEKCRENFMNRTTYY